MQRFRESWLPGVIGFIAGVLVGALVPVVVVSDPFLSHTLSLFFVFMVCLTGLAIMYLLVLDIHRWVRKNETEEQKKRQQDKGSAGAFYNGEASSSERVRADTAFLNKPEPPISRESYPRLEGEELEKRREHFYQSEREKEQRIQQSLPRKVVDPPATTVAEEPAVEVSLSSLIDVWETYLSHGDGRFNAKGLQRQLEEKGISASVIPGEHLEAGDRVLGVALPSWGDIVYLLPNFTKPPRAVSDWFESKGSESRRATIQRLVEPAAGRRSSRGWEIQKKGVVE